MTPTRLGLVEMDLIATHAGASIPYPLRVPSYGRIPAERDELLAAAGETLRLRRLATEHAPTGIAADLATALGERRGTVDLVTRGPEATQGAVAILYRGQALLCRQDLTHPRESVVEVDRVSLDAAMTSLIALVPDLPAATSMPIQLPTDAANAVREIIATDPDSADLEYRLQRTIEEHGGNLDDFDTLIALIAAPSGSGQLGATKRSATGNDKRVGVELCWLDTPSGRVRISVPPAGTSGWISINPLHPADLHAVVRDLTALAGITGPPASPRGG